MFPSLFHDATSVVKVQWRKQTMKTFVYKRLFETMNNKEVHEFLLFACGGEHCGQKRPCSDYFPLSYLFGRANFQAILWGAIWEVYNWPNGRDPNFFFLAFVLMVVAREITREFPPRVLEIAFYSYALLKTHWGGSLCCIFPFIKWKLLFASSWLGFCILNNLQRCETIQFRAYSQTLENVFKLCFFFITGWNTRNCQKLRFTNNEYYSLVRLLVFLLTSEHHLTQSPWYSC